MYSNRHCMSKTTPLPRSSAGFHKMARFPAAKWLLFQVTSVPHKPWHSTPCCFLSGKSQYNVFDVLCLYCTVKLRDNYFCVTVSPLNYCLLVLCPLIASNPVHLPVTYFQFHGATFDLVLVLFVSLRQNMEFLLSLHSAVSILKSHYFQSAYPAI